MATARSSSAGLHAAHAALLGLGVLFALNTLFPPDGGWRATAGSIAYLVLIGGAGGVCLARAALERRERAAWAALGLGLAMMTTAELGWTLADMSGTELPSVSVLDYLYLALYPCFWAGLALITRERLRGTARGGRWLDGAIAAAVVASLGASFLLGPIREAAGGNLGDVAFELASPLGDVVLLVLVVGAMALTGWRPTPTLAVIALGLAVLAVGDAVYLLGGAYQTYVENTWLDLLWPLGVLLIAAPAYRGAEANRSADPAAWRLFAVPMVFAAVAVALLGAGAHGLSLTSLGEDLALVAFALTLARLGLAFRENHRLLGASRREARTDALSGLGNRRALAEQLERAVDDAHAGRPATLALFDLNGFKHYNDTFGHDAGDALIARLAGKLAASVAGAGSAFRMGGDEFCVLLPRPSADGALADASAALRETGEGFRIDASVGIVELPAEAGAPAAALQLADRRMYHHKGSRLAAPARQIRDVLLQALAEREPGLHAHTRQVGELARAVAGRLRLDAEGCDVVARAAELHDIGKVAIPDAILSKREPLDDEERAFLRCHTIIGERIVSAAPALRPVAAVVRAIQERWDGAGYPDGLSGEAIPLAARIIAVCDAYSVMRHGRPYSASRDDADALAELRACAGTQFDPVVVKAIIAVMEQGAGRAAPANAA